MAQVTVTDSGPEATDLAAERLADAIAAGRRPGRTVHLSLAGGTTPRACIRAAGRPGGRLGGGRAVAWRRAPGAARRPGVELPAGGRDPAPGRGDAPTPFRPAARRRRPRAPTRARSGGAFRRGRTALPAARSRAPRPRRGRPRGLALPARPGAGRPGRDMRRGPRRAQAAARPGEPDARRAAGRPLDGGPGGRRGQGGAPRRRPSPVPIRACPPACSPTGRWS